jgi:hypothetical protein
MHSLWGTIFRKYLLVLIGFGLFVAGGKNAANAATTMCAQAAEGATAKIQCPAGQVVKSLQYASYGTPSGACNSFQTTSCHSAKSGTTVQTACVGKSSCQVAANNTVFGDPCPGVTKKLAIQVQCDTGTAATPAPTPKPTATPTPSRDPASTSAPFYGVNGHISWNSVILGQQFATQITQLKSLGVKIYRNDVRDQNNATNMATFARQASPNGIQVYPVLIVDVWGSSNETDAYNRGLSLGKAAANTLKGLVKYYEIGNEYDSFAYVSGDGVSPNQYDNAKFRISRGAIRGMIAGVKTYDTSAQIIIGGSSWLHFSFNQMLAAGTEPSGGSGNPKISWDITAWHWYSDMGHFESATGGSGNYNVAQKVKDMGKPIWITEFGTRAQVGNDSQQANYLTGSLMLGGFYNMAAKYNIQSVQLYELYDDGAFGGDGNYGLIKSDGKTLKPQFTAVQTFIKNHPK